MRLAWRWFWRIADPVRQAELERVRAERQRVIGEHAACEDAYAAVVKQLTEEQMEINDLRAALSEANALLAERHWEAEGTPEEECDEEAAS